MDHGWGGEDESEALYGGADHRIVKVNGGFQILKLFENLTFFHEEATFESFHPSHIC
jgi:hypothetical protein